MKSRKRIDDFLSTAKVGLFFLFLLQDADACCAQGISANPLQDSVELSCSSFSSSAAAPVVFSPCRFSCRVLSFGVASVCVRGPSSLVVRVGDFVLSRGSASLFFSLSLLCPSCMFCVSPRVSLPPRFHHIALLLCVACRSLSFVASFVRGVRCAVVLWPCARLLSHLTVLACLHFFACFHRDDSDIHYYHLFDALLLFRDCCACYSRSCSGRHALDQAAKEPKRTSKQASKSDGNKNKYNNARRSCSRKMQERARIGGLKRPQPKSG